MNRKTIFTLVFSAILIAGFTVACNSAKKPAQTVNDTAEIPVKLVSVSAVKISDPIISSGVLASSTEARLAFKTGGVIQRIFVQEGALVRKGQLLATINLTEVNALAEQAKQGLDKSQRDFDRAQNLYRDTVATLEQFQNATTGLNVSKQQYEMAKFNQAYSEIRATSDGRIVRKIMNEGEIVGPGTPVFFMNATGASDWVVKVGIADKDWSRLKIGNTATVFIDAYAADNFSATVSQLAQAPDPMSGLYQIELKLKPSTKALATGLFTKVEITPSSESEFISAPIDAIIEGNGNEAFVFIAANNKARKQPVKVAFIRNGNVLITAGLTAGDKIITDGSAYLTDGSLIKVVQ